MSSCVLVSATSPGSSVHTSDEWGPCRGFAHTYGYILLRCSFDFMKPLSRDLLPILLPPCHLDEVCDASTDTLPPIGLMVVAPLCGEASPSGFDDGAHAESETCRSAHVLARLLSGHTMRFQDARLSFVLLHRPEAQKFVSSPAAALARAVPGTGHRKRI